MCENPTNQFLTFLGFVHICFQPYFLNMALDALWRRESLVGRLHNDLIQRLCLAGSAFLFLRYVVTILKPEMLMPRSEACPNTDWLNSGFDASVGEMPPNVLGHSCTYISNATEFSAGHLAWALPLSTSSYFLPNSAIHSFLMFAPALVHPDPIAKAGGVLLCVTGPILAAIITPSLNEQAAIWCFFSICQIVVLVTASYFLMDTKVEYATTLEHKGDGISSEEPIHYTLTSSIKGAKATN